jgi:hypothetical protein
MLGAWVGIVVLVSGVGAGAVLVGVLVLVLDFVGKDCVAGVVIVAVVSGMGSCSAISSSVESGGPVLRLNPLHLSTGFHLISGM